MLTFSQFVYMQPIISPISGLGSTIQPAGAYVDTTDFDAFGFLLSVGNTDRTTQTIQIVQATAAAGTGSKNLTGAVNTTLSATDDNKLVFVESTTEKLDTANGFRYIAIQPTFSGGTVDVGAIVLFMWRARRLPVTQPATVFQTVVV